MTSKNHISCKKTIVIRNSQTSRNVEIIASDLKISIFLSIELEFKDEQVSYYLGSVWISLLFSLCKQLMQYKLGFMLFYRFTLVKIVFL
jgi:hypothetical protein